MDNNNKKLELNLERWLVIIESEIQKWFQTFWFVRLSEGEMRKNVAWKWQKCHGEVEEDDGDRNPVCKYSGRKVVKVWIDVYVNIDFETVIQASGVVL